ncbi:MAG TPA: 2-oxoglutarate dehydrogenase complex dihydrolipoyllysine-residue succinyltransferase [Planctomycetota bacterium]|nr:2-oxoglutarate dehydrogenase complex dihydrolipoyllysine-residue succinyltransferase [Planctomycetota bacterium]
MAVELKVPTVGESIKEVEIGDWLKNPGDHVNRDESVVILESDKATVEIPAPVSGVVTKVLKKKRDKAAVGEVIGYMDESADGATPPAAKSTEPPKPEAKKAEPPAPAKASRLEAGAPKTDAAKTEAPKTDASKTDGAEPPGQRSATIVMPAARRALAEHHVDPGQVVPTGPGGRMLKEDVLRHAENKPAAVGMPEAFAAQPPSRQEEAVPMTPMRRRIAERLVHAQNAAALLTTFNEIDMSGVMALRAKYKDAFAQRYNVKLGFMSFFVKAAVDALKLVPQVNAEIRGEEIVYHNYCDIGIAVGGGKGLVVPILRNAERMSFAQIEMAVGDFGKRAQENKIGLDELKGGTFTISNGGVYGSLLSTPIINPPQSGILGLHTIQERPIALNGQVVIRPMMYVALTYDHRIIDGREAVTFLKRLKESVEEPSRMLLEI